MRNINVKGYEREIEEFHKQDVMETALYNELVRKINAISSKERYKELSLEDKRKVLLDAASRLTKHHLGLR